jgi:hypothetical protein
VTKAPKAVKKFLERIAREGAKARNDKLSPERRSEIARKAAETRWAKRRKPSK